MTLTLSAVLSSQIERALTVKPVSQIDASGWGWTGILLTIHDVLFAKFSGEAGSAYARESRSAINASSAIFAGICFASIIFVLAPDSGEVGRTGTVQTAAKILALTSVHTRVTDTSFRCRFTVLSICSGWTPGTEYQIDLNQNPFEGKGRTADNLKFIYWW